MAKVRGYYQNINGRIPGKDSLLVFGNYVKYILKGLGEFYLSALHRRLPLLVDYMISIRSVMNLSNYSSTAL